MAPLKPCKDSIATLPPTVLSSSANSTFWKSKSKPSSLPIFVTEVLNSPKAPVLNSSSEVFANKFKVSIVPWNLFAFKNAVSAAVICFTSDSPAALSICFWYSSPSSFIISFGPKD